jgi:DNA-binding GntR family transcriptional regulator
VSPDIQGADGFSATTVQRSMLSDQAYAVLRAAILKGDLKPGEKLVVRLLEERLRLSPTPIKAALIALQREGFITAVPHRGFFVTQITAEDMQEIYELREALESLAASKAAEHTGREALADRLGELLDQQFTRVEEGDLVAYSDLDLEFHHTIWAAASNRRLLSAIENLVAQVRFGSGTSSRLEGRLPKALREHVGIVAAIRGGNVTDAAEQSREHVRLAGQAFAQYFARQASRA